MATSHQIEDRNNLPAAPVEVGDLAADIGVSALPPSLQILLNDGLYTRMKQLGMLMANAEGFTPKHLIGKGEACFAVINCALDWKLNPHFVARHTYQTPGGQIGFDGALTQAVLEKSGKFIGAPKLEYFGDWQKLVGKFERKTGQRGGEYLSPTWTDHDAIGLGIVVRWQVRGEEIVRVWPGENQPFWLTQCHPRNSTLWATDPKTQIAYLAIRRFANLAAPGIVGAAGFDPGDVIDASELARDVTPPPRPRREEFMKPQEPLPTFVVINEHGEEEEFAAAPDAVERVIAMLSEYSRTGSRAGLEICFDNNDRLIADLNDADKAHLAREIEAHYRELVDELRATAQSAPQGTGEADHPPDPPLASPASHQHRNGGVSTASGGVERLDVSDAGSVSAGSSIPLIEPTAAINSASTDEPPETGEEGAIVADRTSPPVAPDPLASAADASSRADRAGQENTIDHGANQPPQTRRRAMPRKEVMPHSPSSSDERAKHNATAPAVAGADPTDIVAELSRKLTEAAQRGQKALDQSWLRLSEQERDLARPMRAHYREIAAQVRQ